MKWTKEKVYEEALKHKTRTHFYKAGTGAYHAANRYGILDDICLHMDNIHTTWTEEKLQFEALKYASKSEFVKNNQSAYKSARKLNVLNKICSHMPTRKERKEKWTKEMVIIEALKYTTRSEFIASNIALYKKACRNDWLDEVCEHMEPIITKWTKEMVYIEALNYTTRGNFQKENKGAYLASFRNDWLDEVCEHMSDGLRTDADIVYLWKIPNTNIFKIGITSKRLNKQRIKQVATAMNVDYEILGLFEVNDALKVESELHKTYQIMPTSLPKNDGYTEFRILTSKDVSEIIYYLENVVNRRTIKEMK